MKKRKQLVLNKRLQAGTALSIVGIQLLMISLIVAIIGSTLAINNNRIHIIMKSHEDMIVAQHEEIKDIIKVQKILKANALYADAVEKFYQNREKMVSDITAVHQMNSKNSISLAAIIVFALFQGVILYFVIIRRTHRIHGPMYLMERQMEEIIGGTVPSPRPLREHDEFKEFYDLFWRTIRHAPTTQSTSLVASSGWSRTRSRTCSHTLGGGRSCTPWC